jgi:hypothetical protein
MCYVATPQLPLQKPHTKCTSPLIHCNITQPLAKTVHKQELKGSSVSLLYLQNELQLVRHFASNNLHNIYIHPNNTYDVPIESIQHLQTTYTDPTTLPIRNTGTSQRLGLVYMAY